MQHIKRASITAAKKIALPIILSGIKRRGSVRSEEENKKRNSLKLKRDEQNQSRPHICSI